MKDTEEENSASDDLQAIVSVLSQYNRANLGQFVANAGQPTYRNQKSNSVISIVRPKTFRMSFSSQTTWPFTMELLKTELLNVAAPTWTILETFRLLSFDNIILILSTLLMEKSVAVVSSNPAISYAVACAFTALLMPLEWQATFIPCQ